MEGNSWIVQEGRVNTNEMQKSRTDSHYPKNNTGDAVGYQDANENQESFVYWIESAATVKKLYRIRVRVTSHL